MRKLLILACALLPLACSKTGNGNGNGSPDMATAPPPPPTLAMSCMDTIANVYSLPTGLPAYSKMHRGEVIRCAYDRYVTASQIDAATAANNFVAAKAASGAWIFRVAFRTERITPVGGTSAPEGDTSALLLIPDKPQANGPLVVYGHGTTGLGDSCAISRIDPLSMSTHTNVNAYGPAYLLEAGAGWTVIAPDYSGFNYGQPPGWSVAEDEAHAILDATTAAAHLLPSPPPKVVFIGHSQGGQAVLAAHSFAKSYGMTGQLIGVLAYAPLWFSPSAWSGLIDPSQTMDTQTEVLYSFYYFWSHGMLYDGSVSKIFQSSQMSAVQGYVFENDCYWADPTQNMKMPGNYYDPNFVNSVSNCGTGAGPCSDMTATAWTARWAADRPKLDPNGPPIIIWSGTKDTLITPNFMQCTLDNINAGLGASPTTQVSTCVDATADHPGVVGKQQDWANRWILSQIGGGAAPTCTAYSNGGMPCVGPPPNNY